MFRKPNVLLVTLQPPNLTKQKLWLVHNYVEEDVRATDPSTVDNLCNADWLDVCMSAPETEAAAECEIPVCSEEHYKQSASVFSVSQTHKKTLCPDTEITINDIVLMVLSIGIRHNLTWLAQLDILKLVKAIFPEQKIPLTKHLLMKRRPVTGSMGIQVLEFRKNRKKVKESNIEDIFDGSQYRLQCQPGFILSDPNNFSYNFFTDGVPMGHSGKSIWPIYLMINELPEKIRNKYLILGGLYVGPKEPNLNVFMKPFVDEANKLSSEGFTWTNKQGLSIVSKAIPMCAVADGPARARLLNQQGHSAYWGCTYCYHYKSKPNGSSVPRYLIQCNVNDRTKESTDEDIKLAEKVQHLPKKSDRQHRGVYGPSSISQLNHFDITRNVPVDYMHCLLLGVARAHTNSLLDSEGKGKFWITNQHHRKFSIEDVTAIIDDRLLKIKPPKSITRPPQSITKRKGWKASEWRSWILFYCIVCLKGVLKDKYLVHLAKLCKAAYILLQNSVSPAEVQEAHALLLSYQCDYQENFGEDSMVYQIHLLGHVCKGVLRFGPLWTHSPFPFEAQNRYMLQMLTSPYSVVKQIVTRYLLNRSFPDLCVSLTTNGNVAEFCEETLQRHLK
ncbi:hypothetical protein FOCC_FOCC016828, partial [Frankliniella occidentalis]